MSECIIEHDRSTLHAGVELRGNGTYRMSEDVGELFEREELIVP